MEEVFDLTKTQKRVLQKEVPEEEATKIAKTYITVLKNPGVNFTYTQEKGSHNITMDTALQPLAKKDDDDEPRFEGEIRLKWRC